MKTETNNLPPRIRQLMHDNERDLLAYLRKFNVFGTHLFSNAWRAAFQRLSDAKKITYKGGYYKPVKGARPVTRSDWKE